jgi:hypothetical protein
VCSIGVTLVIARLSVKTDWQIILRQIHLHEEQDTSTSSVTGICSSGH